MAVDFDNRVQLIPQDPASYRNNKPIGHTNPKISPVPRESSVNPFRDVRKFLIGTALALGSTALLAEEMHLLSGLDEPRRHLEERGMVAEAILTTDTMYNVDGGIERDGTLLGNLDLTLEIDTGKAGLWKNGTFLIYGLGNFNTGKLLTEIVGDFQATSNIETDRGFKLYEAWYEHRFGDDASLLFGLHDFNSEFDVVEYGGIFLHSSFGISADISQNGPSIFSVTALGARLKVWPTESTYIMTALYDGVPGDPTNPTHTSIQLDKGDGLFGALEIGHTVGIPGSLEYFKYAMGTWMLTAEVENFAGTIQDENSGIYFIGEKTLFEDDAGRGSLGAFVQLGFTHADRNQVDHYWGAGLNYTGLIPSRSEDIAGLALANARNGSNFIRYARDVEGLSVDHTETAIELTYMAIVQPWLTIQPDLQYVINPGMDSSLDNALVAGVRVEVAF